MRPLPRRLCGAEDEDSLIDTTRLAADTVMSSDGADIAAGLRRQKWQPSQSGRYRTVTAQGGETMASSS